MTTGPTRSSDGLELRRRRVLYRAHHRGTRELDLLLGRFADVRLDALDDAELAAFEHLLDAPEPELMAWLVEDLPVAEAYDTAFFAALKSFTRSRTAPFT